MEEARTLLLEKVSLPESERVDLEEAYSRISAEDVQSPSDVPGYRRSALDGYGFNLAELGELVPAQWYELSQVEEIPAGKGFLPPFRAGGCVRIFTGAPVPDWVDTVIRQENVVLSQDGRVRFQAEGLTGCNVIEAGSEIRTGQRILCTGERITAHHLSLAAASGYSHLKVFRRPLVGVFSVGSELKVPGETLGFGQIYNSNLFGFLGLIREMGCIARSYGCVPDDVQLISQRMTQALKDCDIVLTTGGASVGDYDLVKVCQEKIGATFLFDRIGIKPGSPVVTGVKDKKLLLGFSGNPGAAFVAFDLLGRPVLSKMTGNINILPSYMDAVMVDDFRKKSPTRRFLRVRAGEAKGQCVAQINGCQDSSVMSSMIGCNALVDIPAGSGPVLKGSSVRVLIPRGGLFR